MVKWPFRREKKEDMDKVKNLQVEKVPTTILEKICGDDKEAYKALWHTMFYDPRKLDIALEEAEKRAEEFEEGKNSREARIWYHIAGGLAIWKGDVAKVKRYFEKCAEMEPEMDYGLIIKVPERAVEKAQEFYKEYLK